VFAQELFSHGPDLLSVLLSACLQVGKEPRVNLLQLVGRVDVDRWIEAEKKKRSEQ
jgi:hypothetical protein